MKMYNHEITVHDCIEGAGGGSKKQRTPVEAPNTLQSRATIRVQEVISEGETKGVVGGLKGVYFDDTVIQNQDGTFNFPAVKYDERRGTSTQTYMAGFPGVESAFNVGIAVDDTPVIRSVSSNAMDAARILIRLPAGLFSQDMTNGDTNGFRVGFAIDVRPTGGGAWQSALSKVIQGKTMDPYEAAFRVERPTGTGGWDIRVRRTTRKSVKSSDSDALEWSAITEIQDVKVAYEDAAVVGIAWDAEATAGAVPKRAYLYEGVIVNVPTNYTPTVYNADGTILSYASYSGTWNGLFKKAWCDDPAWILYDMLINERYGAGEYMAGASIDVYSFYEASRYNCELIPAGDGSSNLEPRFRMDTVLQAREDSFRVLQTIAATFRAVLYAAPGAIRLIQDRPRAVSYKINNSRVIDGQFNYVGSDLPSRMTAVDVTYNDMTNGYIPATVTWENTEAVNLYGFNKQELSALGVVNKGQAIRLAKWAIESSLTTREVVTFSVGPQNAYMEVGDIVEVADEWYAEAAFTGLIVGGTPNSINLDTSMTITAGTKIAFMTFEGVEVERTVSTTSTGTNFQLTPLPGSPNPGSFPNAVVVVAGPVVPRQFKVTEIRDNMMEQGTFDVTAAEHDPTKYARIEQGIYVDPPVFTNITNWTIGRPGPITVSVESYINPQNIVRHRLRFNAVKVEDPLLRGYRLQWRRDNGPTRMSAESLIPEIILEDCEPGVYEFTMFAYNQRGVQSPGRSDYFVLEVGASDTSPANAPTDIRLIGGGTQFSGTNFTVTWTPGALTTAATVLDYEVVVRGGASSAAPVVHREFVAGLTYTIDRSQVIAWAGSAIRNLFIEVRARDAMQRYTAAVGSGFSNPAPPPLQFTLFPWFNSYDVNYVYPTVADFAGVVVHHSTSPGFTPLRNNIVAQGRGLVQSVPAEPETTYYVRAAVYDSWSDEDLTYGPEQSVTTTAEAVGIIPTPPTNLTATSVIADTSPGVQQARITVTWGKSSNTDMYDLEILAPTIGVAEYPVVTQPESGSTVSYSFYGVPAAVYNFRIRSRAATNVSEWSAVVTHTAAADTIAPALPTSLTVTSGFGSAALKWVNPTASDLSGIMIYRRKTSAPTVAEALITTVPAPLTAYFDSGLEIGGTYQYRIRAIDRSANMSGYTGLVSVAVGGLPNGSVGTGQLLDDAVTAAALADGAVTAPAILAGSIVASKLAIGDWSNIVPDPQVVDDASWTLPTNFAFVQQTNSNLNMRSKRVIQYTKPAGATGYTPSISSRQFAVEPGQNYYVSLQTQSVNNASHNVLYRLFWFNSSGGSTAGSGYTDVYINEPTNNVLQSTGGQVTAPTGAVSAQLAIYVQQSSTAATGIWIGGPVVRRAQGGELIVDGAVTTDKLFANAVTAAKIAANTITANEINAGSIRAAVLVANSISTAMLQANAVNADKIDANSIRAAILVANSITATMIAANQITATHIGANTIVTNSANIADAVIISAKIQNGAIENAKIANGAITNVKISGLLASDNYVFNSTGWGFSKSDGSLSLNGNVPGQGRTTLTNTGLFGYDGAGNLRFAFGL